MEECIAAILPATKINTRYEYNGTELNLGGKIVEAVTGEAWPFFYQKHIIAVAGVRAYRNAVQFGYRHESADGYSKICANALE